jgi:[protein-PII] uridylyltransferase
VADVFYVTSMDGEKVEEVGRLETIRASILNEIEVFLGAHAA